MTFTSANANPILKTLFPDGRVKQQVYPRHPFFGLVPKDPTFEGDAIPIPIIYSGIGGASATFSKAQENKTGQGMAKFSLTTVEDYATVSVTRKLMLQTRSNKGARLKAIEQAHSAALYQVGRSISGALYRDGEGVIGQISAGSNVGTATITLADPADAVNFEVGMQLVASEAVGGALRSSSATVLLTAVDYVAGTLTASGNWSAGIGAVAAGDYLYREGDARNNGSAVLKLSGLDAWLPNATTVSSSSFFGVDRSVAKTRLAGIYADVSSYSPEEALIELQSQVNTHSLGVDTFLNNNKFKRLIQKALGSKVQYAKRAAKDEKGDFASVSFETIRIEGDKGPIDLIADPDCPSTLGYMLRMDSWCLYSMLAAPHIFDEGTAQEDLREPTADAYEGRVGAYLQLGPAKNDSGPGDNGVGTLPTA